MQAVAPSSESTLAVMKFSALGDIAMQLPFFRAIGKPFCIITSPIGKLFLEDEFTDFIVLRDKSLRCHLELLRAMRRRHFDDLIDLQGNDRSRFLSRLTGSAVHNGYDPQRKPAPTELVRDIRARAEANPSFVRRPRSYIVFNMGSSAKWAAKRPPMHKWVEFAEMVNRRFGLPIRLTGSAEEREYIDSIAARLPGDIEVLAGETNLQELKKLLTGAFLTVSTDSAAMHISAVQGTPTIGLFGSTTHESKLKHPWTCALYDRSFYPDGIMPVCTDKVGAYYDHIDLNEGLDALEAYLV